MLSVGAGSGAGVGIGAGLGVGVGVEVLALVEAVPQGCLVVPRWYYQVLELSTANRWTKAVEGDSSKYWNILIFGEHLDIETS